MWRNDRIQMIARDCAIDSGAGGVGRVGTRGYVVRVVRVTDELFRQKEYVLIVVNKLLWTMRVVERNKIGKRAHVCVRKRLQIVRDLRPEFVEQRSEFVAGVGKHITGVGIDDRRAETLHHLEGVIRERDRLFVARDAASEII